MAKNGKSFLPAFFILVIFVSASCDADSKRDNSGATEISIRPIATTTVNFHDVTTATLQIIPSKTVVDRFVTPSPSLTSTMTVDQRIGEIENLVIGNEACRLPCFFGIWPGKTTWNEAKAILDSLSFKTSDFSNKYGISHYASLNIDSKNQQMQGTIQFLEEKGLITIIVFTTNSLTATKYFPLSEVFKTYGKPDSIGVDLRILGPYGLPDQAQLELHIAYGNTWLHLYYEQMALRNKTTDAYIYCPNNPIQNTPDAKMSLIAQSKEELNDRETLSSKLGFVVSIPPSIEVASNTSVDQFYRKVIDGRENFCLGLPVKYWMQFFSGNK